MKSINVQYIQEVDHLRAFAAGLIVMHHAYEIIVNDLLTLQNSPTHEQIYTNNPILSLIIEGQTAVSLFMVLSGFILAYGSINKDISYLTFIRNRFLRIYPLFIFLLFVGISIYPNQFTFSGFIQTILGFSNNVGALDVTPFSTINWAISVEFTFYLIFPFLIIILKNNGYKKLLLLLFTFILFRVFGLLLGGNPRDFSYWTLLGRMDQFIIGILLANVFLSTQNNAKFKKIYKLLFIPSVIAVFYLASLFNNLGGHGTIYNWKILLPTIEAVIWSIFIMSFITTFSSFKRTKISNLVASLGIISYSTYLTHMIIIYIITINDFYLRLSTSVFINAFVNSLIVYVITMVVSILTYNSIEKPFLNLRRKYIKVN